MPQVRPIEERDIKPCLDIYSHWVTNSVATFEIKPPTMGQFSQRIQSLWPRYPFLVYETKGNILGFCYAQPFNLREAYRWTAESSVYVHSEHQGNGIGRELSLALLDTLKVQNIYSVLAGIALPNESSVGLHESLGYIQAANYRKVGFKFDEWHDVNWYQISLTERNSEPVPVVNFSELLKSQSKPGS